MFCSATTRAEAGRRVTGHRPATDIVQLGVPEQKLHRAQVPGAAVDQGSLGPVHRMGAVVRRVQADLLHPGVDDARVLPRPEVWRSMNPAREEEVFGT